MSVNMTGYANAARGSRVAVGELILAGTQKKVQILARLTTLRLVENYTRGAKLENYNWLERSPNLCPALNNQERERAG